MQKKKSLTASSVLSVFTDWSPVCVLRIKNATKRLSASSARSVVAFSDDVRGRRETNL